MGGLQHGGGGERERENEGEFNRMNLRTPHRETQRARGKYVTREGGKKTGVSSLIQHPQISQSFPGKDHEKSHTSTLPAIVSVRAHSPW